MTGFKNPDFERTGGTKSCAYAEKCVARYLEQLMTQYFGGASTLPKKERKQVYAFSFFLARAHRVESAQAQNSMRMTQVTRTQEDSRAQRRVDDAMILLLDRPKDGQDSQGRRAHEIMQEKGM